ncbi:MAG: ribonuclease R family protein [Planctomycetota bacterium]|jgi:ribonuclease R
MPTRFIDRIIKRLSTHPEGYAHIRDLAQELRIDDADFPEFEQAVTELSERGEVLFGTDRIIELPPPGDEVVGTFRKNPKGFGFIIPSSPNAHGDFFVHADDTLDALTGDKVRATITQKRHRGEVDFTGRIVEVLERKHTNFTGVLTKMGGDWIVHPDGKSLSAPIQVRDVGAKNATKGDKVVVEITIYPEAGYMGEGVIVRVLGKSGEPDVETQAVIAAFDLPGEFPEECIEQAREESRKFEIEVQEAGPDAVFPDRQDLRDTFIFTIDPPDAKDFDDAISLERITLDNGQQGWELGVHIADVSHFVTPGSPLDEEAKKRGNSVYLPRLVIPMLPEILSNGVCSLQERVPRFAKSAFIRYDDRAKVVGRAYASTVIHSAKRMTYLEAQALIDGDEEEARKQAKNETPYTDELRQKLRWCNELSRKIYDRRHKEGMIHLDLPEVELIHDEKGRVIDAEPEDDAWTHTVIEMFMVEANEALAVLFERLGVPALRRVHPDPDPSGFENLRKYLKAINISLPKEPDIFDIQQVLDATKGQPNAPAVHFAILRCLTKAEYAPKHIGHYALASRAYSHFTSPIRRYPDLTIHRALLEYLKNTDNGNDVPKDDASQKRLGKKMKGSELCPDEPTLSQIAHRCNTTEERATEAERDLRAFLVMQLLEGMVGEVFEGVVTGVTSAGVFVRINKYLAEGLVKTADLPTQKGKYGRWKVDQRTGALVDQNSNASFRLGDRVEICVSQVNLAARQMELLIPDESAKKREGVGKGLKLGEASGGMGHAQGAGFKQPRTGSQRRSKKSKSRDKGKKDYRQDKKNKGKRR